MNYYYIFDIVLLLSIFFGSYYSYRNKTYLKIFKYFKLFVLITASAKLAPFMGTTLQKFSITQADTYTTLILISFSINLLLFYYFYQTLFKLSNTIIQSNKIKDISARVVSFLEVIIIITFGLYIFMQISLSKQYLYPTLKKTYSYPKIKKFYNNFLSDEFVKMVMSSDTGTNHKEVIFKSLKNSF